MNLSLSDDPDQKNSATKQAYHRLRGLILTGELAPGEKLKIERLREMLGTGASPIREALSLLVSDQLVVRHEQRGFRAAETGRENFDEILDLRCTLEGKALRKSIEHRTTEWEEQLVLLHHRMTRLTQERSDAFEQVHKQFHMALIGNCQAPLLQRFCSQLYDLNIRYRHLAGRSIDYRGRKIDDEHLQILNATIEKDADRAVNLLASHYEKTGDFLKAFIK